MAERRMTKKWLKHHLTYSWWKYLLMTVLCVFGVNLLFTMTQYRPPEEKKLELYVLNDFATTQTLREELWPLLLAESPDQEELTVLNINLNGNDSYAYMQFSTYVGAQQGDVCIMPKSEVIKLAASGAEYAFAELTAYVESGVIDTKDIDLRPGILKREDGTEGLYAIPADTLYGLLDHGNDPADSYLVILDYCGNDENAAKLINLMIGQYHGDKPEGYDEFHQSLTNQSTIF